MKKEEIDKKKLKKRIIRITIAVLIIVYSVIKRLNGPLKSGFDIVICSFGLFCAILNLLIFIVRIVPNKKTGTELIAVETEDNKSDF